MVLRPVWLRSPKRWSNSWSPSGCARPGTEARPRGFIAAQSSMRLHGAAMQCTLLLAMAQVLSALSGDPRERGHQLRRR